MPASIGLRSRMVAVEATGTPSTLAAALHRLDAEINETPARDLREVSGISSLSIPP